jgi:hypothetical protein
MFIEREKTSQEFIKKIKYYNMLDVFGSTFSIGWVLAAPFSKRWKITSC